jgi:GNAT superfamily N-acetyltransferase
MTAPLTLRPATPSDVPQLLKFIRELAAYERAPDAVRMTEPQLHAALFAQHPRAEAVLVEFAGKPEGFAAWYESFNTWTGKPGLYLEDLYVTPAARGQGAGKLIFQYLAGIAVQRDYARMEWSVLDWNEPAINFYKSRGAEPLDEWTKYRLTGEALAALAKGADHG